MEYLNFDLLIEPWNGGLRARVISSPAGEARAGFSLPFSQPELEAFFTRLYDPIQALSTVERQVREAQVREFGSRLFEAVFTGEVRGCLQASQAEAARQEAGLRLRLRLSEAPELASLPWEFLYHPALNQFLALSNDISLVRYLELPQAVRRLAVSPPLRILVTVAAPSDYPVLDGEGEWHKLEAALSDLQETGLVELLRLDRAVPDELQERLRQGEIHIFHFIGHGAFLPGQGGMLVFEDEGGRGLPLGGEALSAVLESSSSLQMVSLNACDAGRSSQEDAFNGVAQRLVQSGLPAVIAMQAPIPDTAAGTFTRTLYRSLAGGLPLDAAIGEARRALFAGGFSLEWGIPALYLRAADGRIFDLDGEETDTEKGPLSGVRNLSVGGDVLVAQAGSSGGQAAAGKNILQVGTLVIPTFPALALLLAAAVLAFLGLNFARAGLAGSTSKTPTRMQGAFNVAVVEFGQLDSQGKVKSSELGQQLSKWVYDGLTEQKERLNDAQLSSALEIWPYTNLRDERGRPLGPLVDQEELGLLAARIGADLLIYGNRDEQGNFTPQFYVAPRWREKEEMNVLAGRYRLGDQPVRVGEAADLGVSDDLTTRTSALFYLTVGLSYDLLGRPAKALEVYRQAEIQLPDWSEQGQGKEVLYFLISQAALFEMLDAPEAEQLKLEEEASQALEKALAINSGDPRLYIGRGTLRYNQAFRLYPDSLLPEDEALQMAFNDFAKAADLARQEEDPFLESTAVFAQGTAHYLQALAYWAAGDLDGAYSAFETAKEEFGKAISPLSDAKQYRLLGQVYLAAGNTYRFQARLQKAKGDVEAAQSLYLDARAQYADCIEQKERLPDDRILAVEVVEKKCLPADQGVEREMKELNGGT